MSIKEEIKTRSAIQAAHKKSLPRDGSWQSKAANQRNCLRTYHLAYALSNGVVYKLVEAKAYEYPETKQIADLLGLQVTDVKAWLCAST